MKKLLIIFFVTLIFSNCENEDLNGVCDTPATIRDLTGLDGCGFVFELENGTKLEPVWPGAWCGTPPLPKEITDNPLYNFEFVDGKKVFINYVPAESASICMVGPQIKVTCIREAGTSSEF